jgi:hypothetical protein
LAEGGINNLIAGNHHQPGSTEIKAVDQGAARVYVHQPMMHRIEILWIFPRKARQPSGFIDQHQMIVLKETITSSWHGGAITVSRIVDIRLLDGE